MAEWRIQFFGHGENLAGQESLSLPLGISPLPPKGAEIIIPGHSSLYEVVNVQLDYEVKVASVFLRQLRGRSR